MKLILQIAEGNLIAFAVVLAGIGCLKLAGYLYMGRRYRDTARRPM